MVFLLIACVMLQSFSKTVVAAYWSLNRTWIAQNLCEKRFEKKSCCEGACQLKKWTADEKSGTKDQPPFPNFSQLKEQDTFFEQKPDFVQLFFLKKGERAVYFLTDERLPRAPLLDEVGKPPNADA